MTETLTQLKDFEEEFEDETLSERLWGLTEMFPEKLRSAASTTATYSYCGASKLYSFARSSLWVGTTAFMVLVVPVLFEQERYNIEQQQQQHQRQMLLGPSAAVSSVPSGMGMAPPPIK